MSLRTKTLVLLASTLATLLVIVYAVASRALLRAFASLESESVERSVQSVLGALADEKGRIDAAAMRWASSTAATSRMSTAALPEIPEDAPEDFVAFLDTSGRVTGLVARSDRTGSHAELVRALERRLAASPQLTEHAHTGSSRNGLLGLPAQAALVASRPRMVAGSIVGSVLVGRLFDEHLVRGLAAKAQVSLAVEPATGQQLPDDFAAAVARQGGSRRSVVLPLAGGWIAGYRTIEDVDGNALLIARVDAPRSVFLQGRASLDFLILALLLVSTTFAAVSYAVLDRVVLRKLAGLSVNVARIANTRSLSTRLPVEGEDELSALALRINEMLDARERAQGERGETEARYRAVFEQGGDGVVLFDPDSGRILDANPAVQRMLGYGLAELLELRVSEIAVIAAETLSEHIAAVRRERKVFAGDATFRRKDGSTLAGDVTSSLVAMRGREVVCSVVRDVDERRRLEARLRESQKLEAVGRLASGVAHDFNNLLQAVISSVGLLKTGGGNDAVRARVAATLEAQVASGATFTRQLSLLGRHEPAAAVELDLNELVGETSGFLRRVMRENVRFEVELVDGPLPTVGDRGRLEQCLVNLVTNAAEAMPSGGTAAIRTGRSAEGAWFEVSDEGPGIPPAVRERMFEPFFTTKGDSIHSGLGLTVVQHVVEEHGGNIAVSSRSGEGATLRVTLPSRAAAVAAPSVPRIVAPPPENRGGRILLVEDGEETRRGLAELLSVLGHEVVAAASAEEALADTVAEGAEVLLTDYMLPGLNGAELAAALLERFADMSVIIMSGYAADSAVPADGHRIRFLAKPFGMDTLAREVQAALAARPAANPASPPD